MALTTRMAGMALHLLTQLLLPHRALPPAYFPGMLEPVELEPVELEPGVGKPEGVVPLTSPTSPRDRLPEPAWPGSTVGNYTPGNYYLLRLEEACSSGGITVHGLWPQWAEWCPGPSFDPAKLESIQAELAKWWPSCDPPYNATEFHAHEWSKHGVCTGLDELDYFETALQLRAQVSPRLSTCFTRTFVEMACPAPNATAKF